MDDHQQHAEASKVVTRLPSVSRVKTLGEYSSRTHVDGAALPVVGVDRPRGCMGL